MSDDAALNNANRREHQRFSTWTRANLRIDEEDFWRRGYISNISQRGICLTTLESISNEKVLTIVIPQIPAPEKRVLRARVCWVRTSDEMDSLFDVGMKFPNVLNFSRDDFSHIQIRDSLLV